MFNKDNHNRLNEFIFQPHPTTDYGVSYPLASVKIMYNVVITLAPLFLIGSSSFLQVTKTAIEAWMSSARSDLGLLS